MVFCTKCSLETLVESLRVPPVQQVATELAQELKEYSFGLHCEPQDLRISMDTFTTTMDRVLFLLVQGKNNLSAEN